MDAGALFAVRCLLADDSLFTPGKAIWTSRPVGDLYERYVSKADHSNDDFFVKLERQLASADDFVLQLMAELLFIHLLMSFDMSAESKRAAVETVLGWMHEPVSVSAKLDQAYHVGMARLGQGHRRRDRYIKWFLAFLSEWQTLDERARAGVLADPLRFKRFLDHTATQGDSSSGQRQALYYLVHPDFFEPIISINDKRAILRRFDGSASGDLDIQLHTLRARLTSTYGEGYWYFREPVMSQWRR